MSVALETPPDLSWFQQARKSGTTRDRALAFYDTLEPLPLAAMIGLWKGAGFETGHPLDRLLDEYGWYGKQFIDTETVHPLLFGDPPVPLDPRLVPMAPSRLTVKGSKFLQGLFSAARPLMKTKKPTARLRMTEYRGKLSATMIYDALPVNDIFRRVGPDTLLGAMDSRAFTDPFFFVLERVSQAVNA